MTTTFGSTSRGRALSLTIQTPPFSPAADIAPIMSRYVSLDLSRYVSLDLETYLDTPTSGTPCPRRAWSPCRGSWPVWWGLGLSPDESSRLWTAWASAPPRTLESVADHPGRSR